MRYRRILFSVLLILTSLAGPARALADDRYFMVVFASQAEPNLLRLAHSFATFIKASGDGNPKYGKIEEHTISWLPASLTIEPLRLQPQAGKNVDRQASMAYARSLNAAVSSWGPFPIKQELYERALKQIEFLESGKVAFIVLDRRWRGQGASNCIHALSDVDRDRGFLETDAAHGISASQLVLKHLERWIIPTKEDLHWLNERLGIPDTMVQPWPPKGGNLLKLIAPQL